METHKSSVELLGLDSMRGFSSLRCGIEELIYELRGVENVK